MAEKCEIADESRYLSAAWAAESLAIGTLKGEHDM